MQFSMVDPFTGLYAARLFGLGQQVGRRDNHLLCGFGSDAADAAKAGLVFAVYAEHQRQFRPCVIHNP